MKNIKIDKDEILRSLQRIQGELIALKNVLKLKGAKYFQRPLAIGAVLMFTSYHFLYVGSRGSLESIAVALDGARATATYAEDFKSLKMQLANINRTLPRTKNPQEWLLNSIRKTLREEGIVPLSTSQAKLDFQKGFQFISITVNLQASFPQVASWLSRLERSKRMLYIKSVTVKKDNENIGENSVTVEVTTMVKGSGP